MKAAPKEGRTVKVPSTGLDERMVLVLPMLLLEAEA